MQRQEGSNLTPIQRLVLDQLARGVTHTELARKLSKGDPKKAQLWRNKIIRWARGQEFNREVQERARAVAALGLVPAINGVSRRAAMGRAPEAKLLFALTGFHNDKIQHEHSGGIELKISIPRPETTKDELGPGKADVDLPDADVVEED